MLDRIIVAMKTYMPILNHSRSHSNTMCQRQLDEVRSCKLVFQRHMPQTSTLRSGRHSATRLTSSYSAHPLLQYCVVRWLLGDTMTS